MAERGYMLSRQDARDFNRMRRDMRRQGPPKARRKPRRRSRGSGGGESCPEVHEITTTSSPSSGTATLTYVINGNSDTVTIDYNETSSGAQTAYEAHSEIASGDVECFGGPLPATAVYVKFKGNLAATVINLPSISDSITGGDLRMRKAASYDWGPA